jgi:F-type H+-transporting ATPase subunit b
MEILTKIEAFEKFVGVNVWTMLFAWCNLLIVYFILKKLLFKPVKNMIDTRQKEVDDMYSDAEKNKSDAEKMKAEYEKKVAGAEAEAEEILKNAVRRATLREEDILKEAGERAQRVLDRAEEQIELEKKQAINEVKDQVSELAIGIAAAVIERDVSAEEHEELINDFIKNMGSEQ